MTDDQKWKAADVMAGLAGVAIIIYLIQRGEFFAATLVAGAGGLAYANQRAKKKTLTYPDDVGP